MLNIWALNRLLFQGLWKTHITLKYKDEYDQRGPHGKDFKGSFTSKSLDSQPRCSLVIYVILFVKCKSLYKFPIMFFFFSSDMLMFFCIFRGGFCCPFNHPSTSLFFFRSQSIYKYRKTQHLISVIRLKWQSYWVLLIRSNSNHKPNYPLGGGGHRNMMASRAN